MQERTILEYTTQKESMERMIMSKKPYYECKCPIEAALHFIGGKYKSIILWNLSKQTMRYSELHRLIPKATDKMLAQQLRELEHDGVINRKVYPVVPPKTEYSLTEFGKTFIPIMDALCDWGQGYLALASEELACDGKE